jgi:hypothetical protein
VQQELKYRMGDEFHSERRTPKRLRRIAITLGCIVLGAAGGLVIFGLTAFRRPPPPMSAADLMNARARWQANRPAAYEMTIELSGRQSGTTIVVVHDNKPFSVERGDVAVPKHSWQYWTVEGLFAIIESDLESLDQPERAFGEKDASQLVQQAEFDADLGYPRRYRRAVLSTGEAIEWEIVEFRVP